MRASPGSVPQRRRCACAHGAARHRGLCLLVSVRWAPAGAGLAVGRGFLDSVPGWGSGRGGITWDVRGSKPLGGGTGVHKETGAGRGWGTEYKEGRQCGRLNSLREKLRGSKVVRTDGVVSTVGQQLLNLTFLVSEIITIHLLEHSFL